MSMRQPPSELPETAKTQSPECFLHTTVLRAYVGEQAAFVYSCVYSQRGITLGDLRAKSGIPMGPLKKILVTLIQLGCIVYTKEKHVKYLANEEGCWKLTYVDECVRHVREKFGLLHAEVMQNIVLRGHVTLGAYVKDMSLPSEVEKVEHAFIELVEDKWLVPVKEMDFHPLYKSFGDCVKLANREFLVNSNQYARMDEENGGGSGGGGGGGNPRFKSAGMSQLKKTTIIKDLAKEKFMRMYNDTSGKDELFKVGMQRQKQSAAAAADPGLAVAKGISTLFSDDDEDEDGDGNVDINGKSHSGGNGSGSGSKHLKRLNGNVALTFSLERLLKHERSVQLASICKHRIGNITAKIYAVALGRVERACRDVRCIEDVVDRLVADASVGAGSAGSSTSGYDPAIGEDLRKRLELGDQQKGLNFGAVDILKELSVSRGNLYRLTKDDLMGTICEEDEEDGGSAERERKRKLENAAVGGSAPKKSKLNKVVSPFDVDDDDDDEDEEAAPVETGFELANSSENGEVLKLILQHLKLLTTDKQLSFLVETSPGQFYVPFTALFGACRDSGASQSQVGEYHMKQVVRNVLGQGALRVLNCIERQRLVEEKNIAKSVLMREGDVRRTVATLARFALVEIQEIPRTADRAAMRSIFAFRVNRRLLLAKQTMGRCLVHGMAGVLDGVERARGANRMLLDKVSRADVRGREGELLLAGELAQLRAVVDGERRALAQLQRLRALAGVLLFM
jgi:DNA-directed RNA polymerase III subunit RPC3